jgi:hypothetical protein
MTARLSSNGRVRVIPQSARQKHGAQKNAAKKLRQKMRQKICRGSRFVQKLIWLF